MTSTWRVEYKYRGRHAERIVCAPTAIKAWSYIVWHCAWNDDDLPTYERVTPYNNTEHTRPLDLS